MTRRMSFAALGLVTLSATLHANADGPPPNASPSATAPAPTRDAAAIPPAAGGERISVNIFEFRSSL